MTIGDLIKNKDYDYISWRITLPEKAGYGDTFIGSCEGKNGKLIPHDQDHYSNDEEVLSYREWSSAEIKNGLTVIIKGERV